MTAKRQKERCLSYSASAERKYTCNTLNIKAIPLPPPTAPMLPTEVSRADGFPAAPRQPQNLVRTAPLGISVKRKENRLCTVFTNAALDPSAQATGRRKGGSKDGKVRGPNQLLRYQ